MPIKFITDILEAISSFKLGDKSITGISTNIGTPGVDDKLPTEKAVRDLVTSAGVGDPTIHSNLSGLDSDDHAVIYLAKTNLVVFNPSSNYHPATKKYVDDNVISDHGALTGLGDDDHSAVYISKSNTTVFNPTGDYNPATKKYVDDNAGGGGVTDHGALTGLGDDDHSQYHNDSRGDIRYSKINESFGFWWEGNTLSNAAVGQFGFDSLTFASATALSVSWTEKGANKEIEAYLVNIKKGMLRIAFADGKWVLFNITANNSGANNQNMTVSYVNGNAISYTVGDLLKLSFIPESPVVITDHGTLGGLDHDDHSAVYISKSNTSAFTPTGDYNPATKKYVDDNGGSGVEEAPNDGNLYGRQDSAWEVVPSSSDLGDVVTYTWAATSLVSPLDGTFYFNSSSAALLSELHINTTTSDGVDIDVLIDSMEYGYVKIIDALNGNYALYKILMGRGAGNQVWMDIEYVDGNMTTITSTNNYNISFLRKENFISNELSWVWNLGDIANAETDLGQFSVDSSLTSSTASIKINHADIDENSSIESIMTDIGKGYLKIRWQDKWALYKITLNTVSTWETQYNVTHIASNFNTWNTNPGYTKYNISLIPGGTEGVPESYVDNAIIQGFSWKWLASPTNPPQAGELNANSTIASVVTDLRISKYERDNQDLTFFLQEVRNGFIKVMSKTEDTWGLYNITNVTSITNGFSFTVDSYKGNLGSITAGQEYSVAFVSERGIEEALNDGNFYARSDSAWESFTPGGGGVTDHGALTGLGDDDHSQYHNDSRGDIRYLSKTNTTVFTPLSSYNPATKKYVDDNIGGIASSFGWVHQSSNSVGAISHNGLLDFSAATEIDLSWTEGVSLVEVENLTLQTRASRIKVVDSTDGKWRLFEVTAVASIANANRLTVANEGGNLPAAITIGRLYYIVFIP